MTGRNDGQSDNCDGAARSVWANLAQNDFFDSRNTDGVRHPTLFVEGSGQRRLDSWGGGVILVLRHPAA